MILKQPIRPIDISFLQEDNTLYVFDFRAMGESMDYEIPEMWKYENMFPWILKNKFIVVNESYSNLNYPSINSFLIAKKDKNPKISIFKRILHEKISSKIKYLWTAVPHPEADEFSEKNALRLNYSYSDFLLRNDKLEQKKLLGKLTPNWEIVESKEEIKNIIKRRKGFIKREHGSGGYTVFDTNKILDNKNFLKLFNEDFEKWYFEEFVSGDLFSVQCLSDSQKNEIIIFGFSKQLVFNNKHFIGSDILSLTNLHDDVLDQLKEGINLIKPLLKKYDGFFGIDFILDKENKINILEANIRTTENTIPTLLTNIVGNKGSSFRENVPNIKIEQRDIVLNKDLSNNSSDILRFYHSNKETRKSFFS